MLGSAAASVKLDNVPNACASYADGTKRVNVISVHMVSEIRSSNFDTVTCFMDMCCNIQSMATHIEEGRSQDASLPDINR